MNKIMIKSLPALFAILSFIGLTACQPSGPQIVTSRALTLEEARQQLDEKGTVFANSVEQASELVGFQVVTPSFIPDGFNFMQLMVGKIGAGSSYPPKITRYIVSVCYTQREDFKLPEQSWFSIDQATFDLTSSARITLLELCGKKVKKQLMPGDDRLMLSWQDDSLHYAVMGTLSNLLDEDAMKKIACSIINQ